MFETSTSDVIVLVGGALGRQSGKEEVFPSGSAGKESTCNAGDAGDTGLIPPNGAVCACQVASVVPHSIENQRMHFNGSSSYFRSYE